MKLDSILTQYGIKQYYVSREVADILRESLIESEQTILSLPGNMAFGYPATQITGKIERYNLFRDVEEWYRFGLPHMKSMVGDFLGLNEGEECKMKSWGNILRMDQKIFPHRHFGVPDTYKDLPQSVSGNVFLGGDAETSTTYILGGDKVDIPNYYGQFTLFPPNISHAVRAYKSEGIRVSAAFDVLCTARDPEGYVSGNLWYTWNHQDEFNENLSRHS